MKTRSVLSTTLLAACLVPALHAQVTLVEPGHVLIKHVDSVFLLDPSQAMLETAVPPSNIESIAIDPIGPQAGGLLYVQLIDPPMSANSLTTHVFSVSLPGGIVAPCVLFTGFGANGRGTDMHFDPATGSLVTEDENFAAGGRLATVNCTFGIGTYSFVTPPLFTGTGSFGMQFSSGVGGSDVPAGDIVFTGDLATNGIHSVTAGGAASVTHVPAASLPGGGDDLVIQRDGDWIWVGDFTNGILNVSPIPPHPAVASPLTLQGIFTAAGLPFVSGSRATVCDTTGDLYVSFSGGTGGSGIFRIDETLTTATLVLTVGLTTGTEGIQDLVVGPSSQPGPGVPRRSLYFTVHDSSTSSEQVWELDLPECCAPLMATATFRNAAPNPASYTTTPPVLGTTMTGSVNVGGTTGHAFAFLFAFDTPVVVVLGGGQVLLCLDFGSGELFSGAGLGPVAGPVAIFPVPIPNNGTLCGMRLCAQAVHLGGGVFPYALSNAQDMQVGSF